MSATPKPITSLCFEARCQMPKSAHRKIEDKAQRQRFIEAAREAGASEDEAVFDEALKRLAQHKPKEDREPHK